MYPSDFWNQRYSGENYLYGTLPNLFFQEQIDRLPSGGRILLPAEGEGRNAIYAARKGWQVCAVDFSSTGRDKALQLAAQYGVNLNYQLADIQEWDVLGNGPWDAIALIYAHLPSQSRRAFHRACAAALRPGGSIILEAYQHRQLPLTSGGPKDPDMLYSKVDLELDFEELTPLLSREEALELDEGPMHRGLAEIVRFHGVKPF